MEDELVTEWNKCLFILLCLHYSFSLLFSLSPQQERQFISLLCLLLRLYLSVWSSRSTNYRNNWLGNMVSIFVLLLFCVSVSMYWNPLTLTLFCSASGWIAALTGLNTSIPVGIIMLLIAALFTALSVGSLIMFKKVTQSQSTPSCQHQFVMFNSTWDARSKVEKVNVANYNKIYKYMI